MLTLGFVNNQDARAISSAAIVGSRGISRMKCFIWLQTQRVGSTTGRSFHSRLDLLLELAPN
jgi:hypothetical protein